MKARLAPSILSFDLTNLGERLAVLESAGAEVLHLDVMDGQFVPPITFGDAYVGKLRPQSRMLFEAHLMVETPEAQFEAFAKAGCERIIFHAEATHHAHRLAQRLREMDVSPGVAINPATPVETILELLELVDLVLVMTVNPGWGGQAFIHSMLSKVRRVRELRPDLEIEVDGGVDPTTLPLARQAGANLFVVGSHLAKAKDLRASMEEMMQLCG